MPAIFPSRLDGEPEATLEHAEVFGKLANRADLNSAADVLATSE